MHGNLPLRTAERQRTRITPGLPIAICNDSQCETRAHGWHVPSRHGGLTRSKA